MRPFKPQDRPRTRSVSLGGMHCHLWAPLHAWDTGSVAGLGHWTEQMAARPAGMAFTTGLTRLAMPEKKGQERNLQARAGITRRSPISARRRGRQCHGRRHQLAV